MQCITMHSFVPLATVCHWVKPRRWMNSVLPSSSFKGQNRVFICTESECMEEFMSLVFRPLTTDDASEHFYQHSLRDAKLVHPTIPMNHTKNNKMLCVNSFVSLINMTQCVLLLLLRPFARAACKPLARSHFVKTRLEYLLIWVKNTCGFFFLSCAS